MRIIIIEKLTKKNFFLIKNLYVTAKPSEISQQLTMQNINASKNKIIVKTQSLR